MLVHSPKHTQTIWPASAKPQSAGAGSPLWEGNPEGMASENEKYAPLTVQQNVPNLGTAQLAPRQRINAAASQGEGRAPGWKWGWMRKNIPYAPETQEHKQRSYGPLRTEYPLSSAHPVGSGREQFPVFKEKKRKPTVLAGPETVYYTAAMPPTPTWGEPV